MSQSLLYHAFGVREGYEYARTAYVNGRVEFHLAVREELLVCPECRSTTEVIRKGKRTRRIRSVPIGFKPVVFSDGSAALFLQGSARRPSRSPPFCPGLCPPHQRAEQVCL